ncbi:uncharacterized protein [Anabrus simplex]|uniref:uncharacterized protein n=1 Tax=Anabrus simplex TaxID=316456 RepID=UPI0035A26A5A
MGTKTNEKEDVFTPRHRLDNSVASYNDRLHCEDNGAESAIARSWSGMDNEMVPVDKEQNSTFFKKPPPAGEKSKIQRINKVIHKDFSCKFDKWMPALTVSGRLCVKGKVKGITNSLLITEPVVHRFNNCVVAGHEGIFRLGAFISAGLPSFIAEEFKNGFPRDWSALGRTWFNFKQQGEPESFTWQEMLWNSINMSPDTDGERVYSADAETDGEESIIGNKTQSDTDQSVFHSPLPRSKMPQLSVSHTGRNPLIYDSPSSDELSSVRKRKLASQKNKPLTNDSKNMTNLEETPKSFSRRRYYRNLSFYASLSQPIEQRSKLLDASPHQTPDICTDGCFRSGVNCCSTPFVALENIHPTSNDKQTQGHIISPTHAS